MTPVFTKQTSINGIAYHRAGSGPTLLFIHGVGLRAESWYRQLEALKDSFDVICLDLPEHGASNKLDKSFSQVQLSDYVSAIEQFVSDVITSPLTLCGHSLGALISAELTTKLDQQVLALLCLNAVYDREQAALVAVQQRAKVLSESSTIVGVKQTLARWFSFSNDEDSALYAKQCETWLRDNTVEGYAKAYKVFAEQLGIQIESVAKCRCPMLFMTGEQDPNSTPQMSKKLAQAGANYSSLSQAVVVANAGHMMPLSHADKVIEQIRLLHKNPLAMDKANPSCQKAISS